MNFYELYLRLLEFMGKGGEVMWLIALLAITLWYLIFERCWYLASGFHQDLAQALLSYQNRRVSNQTTVAYLRKALVARLQQKIESNISLLRTLILLCPLFGLLGTVTGMITVFDVISLDSSGDIKLMAEGISKATLPTMASMVIAISGIFAHGLIAKIATTKKQIITNRFEGI